ncbi:MAG TPA: alpha/beta fold hydrolase [Pseudomonadota bacterium]|nr:alpha/beta fold hydrolase [Xanthomonadales bacterium]HQX24709.1 alpha/beta fold hydrolase [Pseudomonadota bacterium]HRA37434.1 alpha/beta fold hydrolase [Pseudomonadota bacterium]
MSAPRQRCSPALQRWRDAGTRFRFGAHSIFVREAGPERAPVLLLLHGFPTASWDWHRMWDALAADFRLVAPDLIGYGYSSKPRAHDYSVFEQAAMVEALLADRGVAEAHVLAHDYGDTVAQELLARYEGRLAGGEPGLWLRSVIWLNGGLFPELHRPRLVQRMLAGPLGALVSLLMSRGRFGASFSSVFAPASRPSAEELDDFWALLAHDRGHRIGHRLIGYIAERVRHRERWVGATQTSRVPRRFIDGLLDPVSGAHMVARYRELVVVADVVELAGVGHYPQIEAPDRVLQACREFWRRIAALR